MRYNSVFLSLPKYLTILACLWSSLGFAGKVTPFSQNYKEQIDSIFKDGDTISDKKINNFIENLNQRKSELTELFENYYIKEEGKSEEKTEEKISEKLAVYNILIARAQKLKTSEPDKNFYQKASEILELNYTTKVAGLRLESITKLSFTKESLKSWSIPLATMNPIEGEASNLKDPITGNYLSQDEIRSAKSTGFDISYLNPPLRTDFWEDIDVKSVDIHKRYYGQNNSMYKGIDIQFPVKSAEFKKIRRTQSKPKIDVIKKINGKMRTFKFKFGSEIHSEPTSASLFTALGYTNDVSKYVRNFKVYFSKKEFKSFRREYASYYGSYDLDKYIKKEGKDENGSYIIFTEGLLEFKTDDLLRAGQWAWGENGNRDKREVRAILLFNMWVSNLDLKESENNKLVLKPREDGEYDTYHLQHDMGFAFGKRFREMPGAYPWKLVKKKTKNKIKMNFNNFQENSGFDHVTYYDAKWMARLISQLTRKQIEDAVALGGWPYALGKLLVEKLIARRNQLVEVFELKDEAGLIEFDRNITTSDGAVVNGELKKNRFDGFTQSFDNEFTTLIQPVLTGVKNIAAKAGAGFIGSINKFTVEGITLGLDSGFIREVIIDTARSVETNNNPTGDHDKFLVKENMKIGIKLGYGYVYAGEVSAIKDYTLIYPAASYSEGLVAKDFVVDLLLPLRIHAKKLPEQFVLVIEDSLQGAGRLKSPNIEAGVPIGISGTKGKVVLNRSFVSHKNEEYMDLFQDIGLYDQTEIQAYFDLAITKIPFFKTKAQDGSLKRRTYRLYLNEEDGGSQSLAAFNNFLLFNDVTKLDEIKSHQEMDVKFEVKKFVFNLLGFFKRGTYSRTHDIELRQANDSVVNKLYQVELEKLHSWSFLDNGEKVQTKVHFSAIPDGDNAYASPELNINFFIIDNNTHTQELKNKYISFVNHIAQDDKFINFSPELYTKNDLWGHTITSAMIKVSQRGIENIINLTEDKLFTLLAKYNGNTKEYYKKLDNIVSAGPRRTKFHFDRLDKKLADTIGYAAEKFKKARKTSEIKKKYAHLVAGIRYFFKYHDQTYNKVLSSILIDVIGENNSKIAARITLPEDKENNFPERVLLFNSKGNENITNKIDIFRFHFEDASETYNLFN